MAGHHQRLFHQPSLIAPAAILGLAGLLAGAAPGIAHADVLLTQNFDTLSVGATTIPNTSNNKSATSTATIAVSDEQSKSTAHSLKFTDASDTDASHAYFPYIRWNFTDTSGSETQGKVVKVSFDYYLASDADPKLGIQLRQSYDNAGRRMQLFIDQTSLTAKNDPANSGDSDVTFGQNKVGSGAWHHIVLQVPSMDVSASGYKVFVDGTEYDDLPLWAGSSSESRGLTQLYFMASNDADDVFYLDNLQVETVPEPGSMALMALGGLAILSRKRRRINSQ